MINDQSIEYQERALALLSEVVANAKPAADPETELHRWYAGCALIGLLAGDHVQVQSWPQKLAEKSHDIADAMTTARAA